MQEMCCGGLIMTRERGPEDLQGKSVCVFVLAYLHYSCFYHSNNSRSVSEEITELGKKTLCRSSGLSICTAFQSS